jgi:hypothetical protein
MEIRLDLSRHCVETEIRRLSNRALGAYFRPGTDRPGLEARIALLQRALEVFDFMELRHRHPDLCGGSTQTVVLIEHPAAGPRLRVGGTLVDPGAAVEG